MFQTLAGVSVCARFSNFLIFLSNKWHIKRLNTSFSCTCFVTSHRKVTVISRTCFFCFFRYTFSFFLIVWFPLFFLFWSLEPSVTISGFRPSTQCHIVIQTHKRLKLSHVLFWFLICQERREFRPSLNVMYSLLPSYVFILCQLGAAERFLPLLKFLVAQCRLSLTPFSVWWNPSLTFKVYIFTLLFCSAIFKYTL